jgi:transcriptional regulator with XRE-family HTH domain
VYAEEIPMASFAERLKELRDRRGLTQEGLAAAIGVARSTIGGYEAPSKQREPEFGLVLRLAVFFGVSTDYLLGKSDDPRPGSAKPFPLPPYVSELSPDLQAFLKREAEAGWPRLRLLYSAELKGLAPEQIEQVLSVLIDVRKREEKES